MPRLTRRRLLRHRRAGDRARRAPGCTPRSRTQHPWETEAQAADPHAGHTTATAATRPRRRRPRGVPRRRGRPRRQRLRPAHDPARLRLGHDAAGSRAGASCASGRSWRRTRRSRSPPASASRPGPTTAASRARRCAPARASGCGSRSSTPPSHPHTIHFHGIHPAEMDGVPGLGGGQIDPGGQHGLRVRRPALRAAPLPLPRAPARRAHRQGPLRRLPDRPEGGPRGGGRDGDGDERLRHELRPRQRALRGQHDRLHLHGQAGRR